MNLCSADELSRSAAVNTQPSVYVNMAEGIVPPGLMKEHLDPTILAGQAGNRKKRTSFYPLDQWAEAVGEWLEAVAPLAVPTKDE